MSAFDDALAATKMVQTSSEGNLRVYREAALNRRYEFTITPELADKLFRSPCYYCGFHPAHRFNGIDRVNNKIGYVESNVVACCQWCNRAKGRFALNDFLEWLNWVKTNGTVIQQEEEERPRWSDSEKARELKEERNDEWRPPDMSGISMKEHVRRKVWR